MSSLPARVRVSLLPRPISPNVLPQLRLLLPDVALETVTQAAAALVGGRMVGVSVVGAQGVQLGIQAGWRGKGIEQALEQALQQAVNP